MYFYIHISYDFLATEKSVSTIKVLFYCKSEILFTLLKAKQKTNQMIMQLSKSTVSQELLITYLKPLPPPDPCYLSLVRDIKDQLACDRAERTQQMKWEACASSLPAKRQECCLSPLPRRLRSRVSLSKPHKDPLVPLVDWGGHSGLGAQWIH